MMGLSFDQCLRIAGYRPAVFNDALRAFMRTRSPGALIDVKSVFPLRRDGAIMLEECFDRGLVLAEDWTVTSREGGPSGGHRLRKRRRSWRSSSTGSNASMA